MAARYGVELRRWGYPAVALVGTHTRPDIVEHLRAFQRVYLVLDQDDAGLEATLRLVDALGPAAIPVALPEGIKDVAELAPRRRAVALRSRTAGWPRLPAGLAAWNGERDVILTTLDSH